MKKLRVVVSPTQAFINVLMCAVVFYLNEERKVKPLVSKELLALMKGWVEPAAQFVTQFKLNARNYRDMVQGIADLNNDEKTYVGAYDLIDSLKDHWKLVQKDVTTTIEQLSMIKDAGIVIHGGSSAALTRIQRNLNKAGVHPDLMAEFREEVKSQDPYLKAIAPLVKKMGGEGTKLTQDVLVQVRETPGMLRTYKKYLELRKIINSIYRNALINIIRENDGKPKDIDATRKELEKLGIKDHDLPKGFKGLVGEDRAIYTSTGNKINGVPPQFAVQMNPDYDPKKDNGYVFKVEQPTVDPTTGKNRVSYYFTNAWSQKRSKEKFSLVQTLLDKEDQFRRKWLRDMRSTDDDLRVPATLVEISYLTCSRIGTPGNSTKGQNTQGLTTLTVGNVKRRGSSRLLDYNGKDGVHHVHSIAPADTDKRLIIKLLDECCEDRQRKDRLFVLDGVVYTAEKVRAYFKRVTGLNAGMHKIRTLRGTKMAQEVLEKLGDQLENKRGLSQTIVDREFKDALTKVGELLGHVRGIGDNQRATWATASMSYIDPEVQKEFYARFAKQGVRLPNFLAKKLKEM